jgi:hypothetical protein
VATANDFGLAELVASRSAAMTTADLHTLAVQAGDVLGAWGASLNLSRELTPVRTSADGKTLLDRAIYVEDATGGYYTLKSGAAVLDGNGNVIARPSFAQILAQGSGWHVEQAWSPDTRGSALQFREAAPYLMHVVSGRAVIDDYGIKQADGSWALASGTAIKDANGNVIASPTKADILAQAHSAGTEWRVESFGFNAFANLPVQNIGIDIVNGQVADYTVRVTDQDGSFYVWARNLDRALALQAKQGTSVAFNLRNYEVDFVKLQQQVDSSDDSKYRIELLTPAEFSFALKLSSIEFQPRMLVATLNSVTGVISYAVNTTGPASVSIGGAPSSIDNMIGLLDPVFKEYVYVSRATAVRMALQGGLSSFAQGLKYDVAQDKYVSTTNKQLAPMLGAKNDNHIRMQGVA